MLRYIEVACDLSLCVRGSCLDLFTLIFMYTYIYMSIN